MVRRILSRLVREVASWILTLVVLAAVGAGCMGMFMIGEALGSFDLGLGLALGWLVLASAGAVWLFVSLPSRWVDWIPGGGGGDTGGGDGGGGD